MFGAATESSRGSLTRTRGWSSKGDGAEPGPSDEERAARLGDRISTLARLRDANPETELLELDLSIDGDAGATLDSGGLAPEDVKRAVATLKTYQRVGALAGDPDTARALVAAGHRSAADVAAATVADLQAAGLPATRARVVRVSAEERLSAVAATMGGVLDAVDPTFAEAAPNNRQASVQDYLRRLPGFAELFGSQAYCDCEHCGSILGPAAYFVDLMRFVDQRLTSRVFASWPEHPLNLHVRRPDLWTTPLTCAATTEEIATLDLIGEILENTIARDRRVPAATLADRGAVAAVVYRDLLSQSRESPVQPFVLPLVRVRAYLCGFERTRRRGGARARRHGRGAHRGHAGHVAERP